MSSSPSARSKSAGSGVFQAVLVTFLFFIATVSAIGYLLHATAERENAAAIESEKHLAQTAMNTLVEDISNRLIDYAWWDDTARHFDTAVDMVWAENNIGGYLQEQFDYSGTFVVSPGLATVYFSSAVDAIPPDAFEFLGVKADDFIATIQAMPIEDPGVLSLVHRFEGATYLVVGTLITYEDLDFFPNARSPRPVLIFYRDLDAGLLKNLGKRYLLQDLSLSASRPDDASVRLSSASDRTEVWLTWTPALPGDAVLNDLFPKIAVVVVALAVVSLLVFLFWAKTVAAANEAKAQFLANMSHELRTPLNPIIGFAEVIMSQLKGPVPVAYREYAADIHRSAKHLQGIIGDVLDFSKVESGELSLRETNLDVEDLILRLPTITSSTWDASQPTAEQSRLPLRYEIEDDLPRVRADELRVRQVLINLLSNAAKFSEGAEVVIRAYRNQNGLCIEVEDSGIGIDKEDLARVFSPFVQAVSSDGKPKSPAGTGLGLSVSRELMRLHGGDLTLKSVPGAGTTAIVNFPPDRFA